MKIKYKILLSTCGYVRIVFMFKNYIHYYNNIVIVMNMIILMQFYIIGIQLFLDCQIANFLIQVTIGEMATNDMSTAI